MRLLKTDVKLYNLKASDISVDIDNTVVDIRDKSPHIYMHFVDVGFTFDFDYNV